MLYQSDRNGLSEQEALRQEGLRGLVERVCWKRSVSSMGCEGGLEGYEFTLLQTLPNPPSHATEIPIVAQHATWISISTPDEDDPGRTPRDGNTSWLSLALMPNPPPGPVGVLQGQDSKVSTALQPGGFALRHGPSEEESRPTTSVMAQPAGGEPRGVPGIPNRTCWTGETLE